MQKNARTLRLGKEMKKWADLSVCLLLLLGLLLFSKAPAENIRCALTLCYRSVIPAVFPFMVVSALLIRTGAHRSLELILGRPIRAIFGCSRRSSSAIILGFLCGFPIGASSATSLYDSGDITKSELERLLIFINNPSAAFVIGGVGLGIFNSAKVGRILYLSVLTSAFIASIVSRFFYRSKENAPRPLAELKASPDTSLASAFTSSISDSAVNMLSVCACVMFFSVPVGIISEILEPIGVDPRLRALLSSFFEISGGCGSSSMISSPTLALMTCAFACSWSGLSVHLQVFSVCRGRDISFAPYLFSKLFQGIISPLLVFLFSRSASELSFADSKKVFCASPLLQRLCLIIFVIACIFSLIKRRKRCNTESQNVI